MAEAGLRFAGWAGYWYPADAAALRGLLTTYTGAGRRGPVCAALVPHAAWQFSGRVAGETLGNVSIPRRCLIVAANHLDRGAAWSLRGDGTYQTPLGTVPIDSDTAEALSARCPLLEVDETAHHGEHSVEALLPFLQWLGPSDLTVAPLIVRSESPEECDQVAAAIAQHVRDAGEPILLLGSAELSHYQTADRARQQDAAVIQTLGRVDEAAFVQHVRALGMQVCGLGPVAAVVGAARRLGAGRGELVRYATSAESGGDPDSVIGFAGMILN